MEHADATRLMAAEGYLLNELTPEQREEFEEHFFDCQECALEVRLGAAFVEYSKAVLASEPAEQPVVAVRIPQPHWWDAWFRPSLVVPVMALLLIAFGYQNFIAYPQLQRELAAAGAPQVPAWVSLKSGVLQGEGGAASVTVRPGQSLLLTPDVSQTGFASYIYELFSPAGERLWSLPVSAQVVRDNVPVQVVAGKVAGTYTLVVKGVESGKTEGVKIESYTFQLQIQQ